MGDGQREEGRWSLPFKAWIVIAVGLLVVIVLGLHVPTLLRYRHERKIAAEVVRLGGEVATEEHPPPWPMRVLAEEWESYGRLFDRASFVMLAYSATDTEVAQLAGLTELEGLDLLGTQVTDDGLVHLAGLTKLVGLYLNGTQITDAGLVHLTGLAEIQRLILDNTQVTDSGLVHLAGLTKLGWLGLYNTQVTDAGVAELKRALPDVTISR